MANELRDSNASSDASSDASSVPASWPQWQRDVARFHQVMGQPVAARPQMTERPELRAALIDEEAAEVRAALEAGDLVAVADGLADLIYVALGTAVECGIDMQRVFAEVQRSNMTKVGGARRADGKVLKPATWSPPDIESCLQEADDE